jgi:hypothetical protein
MPVWGIDDITFEAGDPATWTDAEREVYREGHTLSDPLAGLPLLDERWFTFDRALVGGRDAVVLHPIDGENRHHVAVAQGVSPRWPGGATTILVMDLPSLDHAVAYCNDRHLHIAKVINLTLGAPAHGWPSPHDPD